MFNVTFYPISIYKIRLHDIRSIQKIYITYGDRQKRIYVGNSFYYFVMLLVNCKYQKRKSFKLTAQTKAFQVF